MREPGGLSELGEAGAAAWAEFVNRLLCEALDEAAEASGNEQGFVLPAPDDRTVALTGPDWTGLPVRVTECLGLQRALRLLDAPSECIGGGGRGLQEEYLEWRVHRTDGRIDRVELTTELGEYWCMLAAHAPQRLIETVAAVAGEPGIKTADVFGRCNPFDHEVSPEERERAFSRVMLAPHGRSRYNNGERAVCCMVQETNSLSGLLALAVAATTCRVVQDSPEGPLRSLNCLEAIPLIGDAAQLGRGSDPVLVERFGRLAFEGRLLAFDDPIGIYMQAAEHTRLRTPDGAVVPAEWFVFSRGTGPTESPDGQPRYQRATFQVPPEEGFVVEDLVDVATERQIRHGGQIADLIRLVVLLRVTEPDVLVVDRGSPVELQPDRQDRECCSELREYARQVFGGA